MTYLRLGITSAGTVKMKSFERQEIILNNADEIAITFIQVQLGLSNGCNAQKILFQ